VNSDDRGRRKLAASQMAVSELINHSVAPLSVLLLLVAINGAPILAKHFLGPRYSWPLDGGRSFLDGRPVLGSSKTWRGLIAALVAGAAFAPLLDLAAYIGIGLAATSMVSDALTSFVKRRMEMVPGSRAVVLDQVPEALVPLLCFRQMLALNWAAIMAIVLAFLILDIILSRLSYRFGIRDKPY